MHEIDPSKHVRHTHGQPALATLPVLAQAMLATQKSIREYVKCRDPSLHPLSTHDHEGMPVSPDVLASGVVYMLLDSLDQALLAFEMTTKSVDSGPDARDMPY